MFRIDVGVRLELGTLKLDEFAFEDFLIETEGKPLRDLIIQRVAETFGQITGKHP